MTWYNRLYSLGMRTVFQTIPTCAVECGLNASPLLPQMHVKRLWDSHAIVTGEIIFQLHEKMEGDLRWNV